jgi:O-acetyl-ADP-ribose deacetylase (regulator of RNase III)
MAMTAEIDVQEGDITRAKADAMITAINPTGAWRGGVDEAIQRQAGDWFHSQARDALPLRDTQTVLARSRGTTPYKNVLFVIDELCTPLNKIVEAGLEEAERLQLAHVTLPVIRSGQARGLVEESIYDVLSEIGLGVSNFAAEARFVQVVGIVAIDPFYITWLRQFFFGSNP